MHIQEIKTLIKFIFLFASIESGSRYNHEIVVFHPNFAFYVILCYQISMKLNVCIFAGADDVIAFNSDDKIYELEERDLLLKELAIRDPYDVVFWTTSQTYNRDFMSKFVQPSGIIVDTVEKRMASDDYGLFMRFLCSVSYTNDNRTIFVQKLTFNIDDF